MYRRKRYYCLTTHNNAKANYLSRSNNTSLSYHRALGGLYSNGLCLSEQKVNTFPTKDQYCYVCKFCHPILSSLTVLRMVMMIVITTINMYVLRKLRTVAIIDVDVFCVIVSEIADIHVNFLL